MPSSDSSEPHKPLAEVLNRIEQLGLPSTVAARAEQLARQLSQSSTPELFHEQILPMLEQLAGPSQTQATRSWRLPFFRGTDTTHYPRFYRLLDRLLRHLDVLSGESRDTMPFRRRLQDGPGADEFTDLLDELETFLIQADHELTSERDADLKSLSFAQNQCSVLIEQADYVLAELTARGASAPDDASVQGQIHDAARMVDRLRVTERKLSELLGGLRNRSDLLFKDSLTGAYREQGFSVRYAELFARWQRAGAPLAVVCVALHLSDEREASPLAHDELMRRSSAEIESRIRISDVMGLTAGDAFTLLLPDTSIDGANAFTARLIVALENLGFSQYGEQLSVAVCAGLTAARTGDRAEDLLARTQSALDTARASATRLHAAR